MTHSWDPDRYLTYADERGRPFVELVARIAAVDPRTVVDLGCGPGNLTAPRRPVARRRDPRSRLQPRDDREGPRHRRPGRLRRRRPAGLGRASAGAAGGRAGLQRHPAVGSRPPRAAPRSGGAGRARRMVRLPGARQLRRAQPHDPHRPRRRGAVRRARPRRRRARQPRPGDVPRRARRPGCTVDAWETTYLHVLTGGGPRLHLGLRHRRPADPAGAPGRPAPAFEDEFERRLRAAYPRTRPRRGPALPPDLRRRPGPDQPDRRTAVTDR